MSVIYCKYCGMKYDTDFHSTCPTGNHVEDCDFPFKLDEAGNINTGWGDLVLEVCPHNDWIVELLINSTNHLPVVLAQYAALQSRVAELEGALRDVLDIAEELMPNIPASSRKPYSNYCDRLRDELAMSRALLSACVQPVIDKDVCGKETANNETRLEAPAEETTL